MSAPSPMVRARVFVVLAMAVLMTAAAHAAPDLPVPARGKAAPAPAAHRHATAHTSRQARRRLPARRRLNRETAHPSAHRSSRAAASALHRRRARREIARRSRHRRAELARQPVLERAVARRQGRESWTVSEAPPRAAGPLPKGSEAEDAASADPPAGALQPPLGVSRHFTRAASLRIARGGMPPPLRGSLELLQRQDQRLEADGLERIETEQDLASRIADHLLVPIPVSAALTADDQLSPDHRYCRPWTAQFLTDLARAHQAVFHSPLEVTSAVRPVSYQERLTRINGNAAPAQGDIVSPHVMGATIDIGKKGLSWREIAWMRRQLLALEDEGKIDVEEEFHQACFHITVYRSYAPAHPATDMKEAQDGATDRGGKPAVAMPASLGAEASPGGQ